MNASLAQLEERLNAVRERIANAERRAGRQGGGTTLVGVVKTMGSDVVAAAIALGVRDIGENRVQEAEAHQRDVARDSARWHMIGHLQRNKVARALECFDLVHGVDSADLGEALARRARERGGRLTVLIEVNVSGEASKFGVAPEQLPALIGRIEPLAELNIAGLMTVGAPVARPEDARPAFARLRALRDDAERRLARKLPELSMGMSGDYEVAVEEGATLIRVGTALFGTR